MAGAAGLTLSLGGDWFAEIEARYLQTGLAPACWMPHCLNDAALFDTDAKQGFCFDCAERILERVEAIALNPRMASTLPPVTER